MVIASFALLLIVTPVMQNLIEISGSPTSIISRQIAFDPSILRSDYEFMLNNGDINSYRLAQILDYGFMTGYGLFSFSLLVLLARSFKTREKWAKVTIIIGILCLFSAIFDALENMFILLTLADPINFPDWWALAHSTFAVPKWGILFLAIGWAFIALPASIVFKVKDTKK